MKVSELEGEKLNEWVGRALGWVDYPEDSIERGSVWHFGRDRAPFGRILNKRDWDPSRNISQCWPLIDKYGLCVRPHVTVDGIITDWAAEWKFPMKERAGQVGKTGLIAACRAIVMSVYGEEVPDS